MIRSQSLRDVIETIVSRKGSIHPAAAFSKTQIR